MQNGEKMGTIGKKTKTPEIEKKKREPLNNREKSMIIVVIVLAVALIAKSLFFDEVRNLTGDAAVFKEFVDYSIEQKYDGPLEDAGIIQYRVFDIYIAAPDEKGLLRYEDPKTGVMVEKTTEGRYNARARKVLLWVFPMKEVSVTSQIVE
jgi:hypothetical protein